MLPGAAKWTGGPDDWEMSHLLTAPPSNGQCIWEPQSRQQEFLSADEDEVLYGGAAGGGKSDAALVDAMGMQQGAIYKRDYQALILRRTFGELKDLIERGRDLYAPMGGKWCGQDKCFRFPSRAIIEFGYLKREEDRLQYQGRAFAYINFEEITQYAGVYNRERKAWEPSVAWTYMKSRNRCKDPSIRCYMRATTNPGNIGHEWVKAYWRIPDDGSATCFKVEVRDEETGEVSVVWRRFVPAKLSDNKYLAEGGQYKLKLLQLSTMERRALLGGRWDVVEIPGQIYREELEAIVLEGRICKVPYMPGYPVHTFWDLGRNNCTGIWCMQKIGIEYRFINYYEDRLTGLSTYIKWLQKTGYVFGTHYLPHDGEVEELIANKSRRQVLEDAKIGEVVCVDQIDDLNDGIDMTRRILPACYFDRENTELGVTGLKNYRYEWNEAMNVFRPTPLHNDASTAADSFRQFAQGFMPPREKNPNRARRKRNWRTA